MVIASNNRVKEIRQELNQEKIRSQSLEKPYKDKIEYQVGVASCYNHMLS